MRQIFSLTAVLSLAVASASAAEVVYVTDLTIFSALAPCAQSALAYNIEAQTYDICPEAVTELQSCICTKNNNFASISSLLSSSVSYSCGSTASEDQASAAYALNAYCSQDSSASFATPTAVSAYITELPEFEYMAPCAKSALSYAVGSLTYDRCPSEAPALASCACSKNQNSLVVSQIINTSVRYSCSSNVADVSSAQAMFAAYCAMNNGTTNLPKPTKPPGDMTYYITDLPQFNSLAPCAASGLSYAVQGHTYDLCPGGPQALASCVCIKGGMTSQVLKTISSSVRWDCGSTASEDVTSAVAVYDYYCSAALAEVTAVGVTVSVEQTYPAGADDSGGPQQTGADGGNGGGDGNGTGSDGVRGGVNEEDGDPPTSGPSIGVIVGAVIGVIAALALVGVLIFFLVKSAKKRQAMEHSQIPDNTVPMGLYGGKAELASDTVAAPPPAASPSPSTLKANFPVRTDNVSPVSAHTGAFAPPPNKPELQGQASALYPPMPNSAELHGQGAAYHAPPSPGAPELYGQGTPSTIRPELQGHGAMYPPPPPPQNRSEPQGQGSQFHSPNPDRPELQGQGAMYAPVPDRPELQGQGTQYHNPNPNRPELAGQYGYPQSPQLYHQQPQPYPPPFQQMQGYQPYHPGSAPPPGSAGYGQQQQQQPPSSASWQSGPVPGFHEMDGAGYAGPR
ncbi:hypothetical protein MFIFM68171_06097 [Madurella fahalii]|uniref:Uncharacterized protein n=1 Tax=Madurella fahalii TaxID=1157608 RepID=A0ABQ0GDQ8_9PEZI